MERYIRTSIRMALLSLLLVGFLYPLALTGLGQLLFNYQADGHLIRERGVLRGSSLVGQAFASPRYFHSRPSAAGNGYDPLASGGSNLGPTSKRLRNRVAIDMQRIRAENPGIMMAPVDMVTASGSGLDPDISPASAYVQAPRVARARGMREDDVNELVTRHIIGRQFGVLGEPRVNVLHLNRSLDIAQENPDR